MFSNMAQEGNFIDSSQIPFTLYTCICTSELKTAFQIGFLLLHLVIDMVMAQS